MKENVTHHKLRVQSFQAQYQYVHHAGGVYFIFIFFINNRMRVRA